MIIYNQLLFMMNIKNKICVKGDVGIITNNDKYFIMLILI
jgi:hypothetical protein